MALSMAVYLEMLDEIKAEVKDLQAELSSDFMNEMSEFNRKALERRIERKKSIIRSAESWIK